MFQAVTCAPFHFGTTAIDNESQIMVLICDSPGASANYVGIVHIYKHYYKA